MSDPQRGFWRGPEEGDDIWLLGGLYTFKARGVDSYRGEAWDEDRGATTRDGGLTQWRQTRWPLRPLGQTD